MTNNEGIIIYKKKVKERDLYIKILSENNEIISGMVYAGNTSKTITMIGNETVQNNDFNGNIFEILVFNTAMDPSERISINAYLF